MTRQNMIEKSLGNENCKNFKFSYMITHYKSTFPFIIEKLMEKRNGPAS